MCLMFNKCLNGQDPVFYSKVHLKFVSYGWSPRAEVSGKLVIPQPNVKVLNNVLLTRGLRCEITYQMTSRTVVMLVLLNLLITFVF